MLPIRLPALGFDARLLLESFPLEQVKPAVGARVDEQLEVRIERKLIIRRERRQLDATISGEKNLEPRDRLTNVGQRDVLAFPRAAAAEIIEHDVDRRRQLLRQV